MTTQRLGVIMNGVTGRMGLNQHLIRSIIAIRDQGGVRLANGDRVMPDPILVGRDAEKLEPLAKRFNVARWTTDLDKALTEPSEVIAVSARRLAEFLDVDRCAYAEVEHESTCLLYTSPSPRDTR